jgi:uncharacterized protein (DUF2345 family)
MASPAQVDSIRLGRAESASRVPRTAAYAGRRRRPWVLGAVLAAALGCAAALSLQPGAASLPAPPPSSGLASLPLSAQGPISELLGRSASSYAVRGLRATNAGQRLRIAFSRSGAVVASGSARLGISLSGYGYGAALQPVSPVAPRARANTVTYAHGALGEWYANGPLGLEQGFNLASRPGTGAGPLTLSLSLAGGLAARLSRGSVLLEGHGATLRYGGLVATDAHGRRLRSSLALAAGHIVIRVDDHGATYPLRVDPFVQQAKLTQSGTFDGSFSYSTAVSGKTIVVGDPAYEESKGAAYVFEEPEAGWADATETKKLLATDGAANNFFGESVAISGNTVVVGAPYNKTTVTYPGGAAYVFEASPSKWASAKQVGQLTVSNLRENKITHAIEEVPELQALGSAVAISGSTIVAGAPGRLGSQGAAYVFVKPAEGWEHATSFAADLHAQEFTTGCPEFGKSLAMAAGTVVVGAPGSFSALFPPNSCEHHLKGRAAVFVQPVGGWAGELAPNVTLAPSVSAEDDLFGISVALSELGGTVVVGSPALKIGSNADQGAAYIFEKPGGGWTGSPAQVQLANPSGAADEEFGHAVAISPDAKSLVVAAPGSWEQGPSRKSALYAFTIPAGGWGAAVGAPQQLGSPEDIGLGYSLAVSNETIVAGAGGAAFVFGAGLGINISSPANGATYAPGQVVSAAYTCTAPAPAVVTKCAGPVAKEAAVDTSTLGIHNFIVEAEDNIGGKSSSISVYRVASPVTEVTSTTATTPTTVTLTPAQKAAAEAAATAALEKEAAEFSAWIQAVMSNPENAVIAGKLLNEGGIPVSYKLVPEPGLIATTGSTVSWSKASAARASASSARKKPVVVFKLSYRITKAGKVSFKVPLTKAGRTLLKQDLKAHRSLVIYWTVTFTPQAHRPVTKTFKVTLKPTRAKKRH